MFFYYFVCSFIFSGSVGQTGPPADMVNVEVMVYLVEFPGSLLLFVNFSFRLLNFSCKMKRRNALKVRVSSLGSLEGPVDDYISANKFIPHFFIIIFFFEWGGKQMM